MEDNEVWSLIKVAGHWPGKTSIAPKVPAEVQPIMNKCVSHIDVVKENVRSENYGVAAEYATLAQRRLREARQINGWEETDYWTSIYNGGTPVYASAPASNAVDALDQLHTQLETAAQEQAQ